MRAKYCINAFEKKDAIEEIGWCNMPQMPNRLHIENNSRIGMVWISPMEGELNYNVDGSVGGKLSLAGCRGVLRDCFGNVRLSVWSFG